MRALLTGGAGMLGSAIRDAWSRIRPGDELVAPARSDLDLTNADTVAAAIDRTRPDAVIHAAAVVGGIADKMARPVEYLLGNTTIDSTVIRACVGARVPSMLYVSSAAIYPAAAANPIPESALGTGPLEPANEPYALAKIVGQTAVRLAARQTGLAYRTIAPSNLYGPGDSVDLSRAHLVAATLVKAHNAARRQEALTVWGDGTARREFTFAPDLAEWIVRSLEAIATWPDVMNVGAGVDHSVREYYEHAAQIVGFTGVLEFDAEKPSGVPQRLLDSTIARAHGWAPRTSLRDGMAASYEAFLSRLEPEGRP